MNTIRVSDVQGMLANGKTRKEIQEHYGLSGKDLKHLFQHSKLKGLKTKKPFAPSFEVVDDTNNENNTSHDSNRPMENDPESNY